MEEILSTSTAILVTGATQGIVSGGKGIGKGIVKYYVQRPNTIVVAAVRTPSSTEAKALTGFKTADGSKVILVKIDATSPTDGINAMKTLTALHGINRLDIVIANAGIFEATANQKVADLKLKDLQQHIDVNTYGVIRLFQSTWPLLSKSKKPIFLLNSAGAATMGGMKTYALPTHFVEHPDLIAFAVHPGSVVTENRTRAAQRLGVPIDGISVDECVASLAQILVRATIATTSGTFINIDHTPIPW